MKKYKILVPGIALWIELEGYLKKGIESISLSDTRDERTYFYDSSGNTIAIAPKEALILEIDKFTEHVIY